MNKIERIKRRASAGYDEDFARWSAEQAVMLREGRFDSIDIENVAEEIESLGKSDRKEIGSRLNKLIVHLLKWALQPEMRSGSWRGTIREQRRGIARVVKQSPSLKSFPDTIFVEEYLEARSDMSDETGVSLDRIPKRPPFDVKQVLSFDFFPED